MSARVEKCEPCGPHYQCLVKFVLERPDKKPYREAISILKSIEQALPSSLISSSAYADYTRDGFMDNKNTLVLNCGSSSLKFAVIQPA